MITPERVRELLLAIWGRQACQNPDHWPDVLERLMQDVGSGNSKRASFGPRVANAVDRLSAAFVDSPPTDPIDAVWRAFPMFTRVSCTELAELLIAELTKSTPVEAAA